MANFPIITVSGAQTPSCSNEQTFFVRKLQENTMKPTPPNVPEYIVLDTSDIVNEFKLPRLLSDRDVTELLTQVFDELMWVIGSDGKPNSGSPLYSKRPNFDLLVQQGLRVSTLELTEKGRAVQMAYIRLYDKVEALIAEHLTTLVSQDHGSFNYRFARLHHGQMILKHLNPLERTY